MNNNKLGGTFQDELSLEHIREARVKCGMAVWRVTVGPDETNIMEMDEAFFQMTGDKPGPNPETLEKFIADRLHPEDQGEALAVFSDCLHRPGLLRGFDCRLRHRVSGQWRWSRIQGQGHAPDPVSGLAREVFGAMLDVHEFYTALEDIRKGHRELGRERERVTAIIDAADLVVWDWNLVTGERVYGEALDSPSPGSQTQADVWSGLLSAQDRARAEETARRHAGGEIPVYELEYKIPRPQGRSIWIQDRGRVVETDADGRGVRLMGVLMDVTRRKEAEESLRQQKEQMDLIINAAKVGIWDWDVLGDWQTFNDAYCLMLGYAPGELDGTTEKWRSYVHPEDLVGIARHFSQVFTGPGLTYESTLRMRHKDGHYVTTHDVGRVVSVTDDGQAARIVGVQMTMIEGLKS